MRQTLRILWQFRYYVLSAVVAMALWNTIAMKPFRLFVVMVHEVCHAAATLVTGGAVLEIRTHPDESGHTIAKGGFFPVITAAGYVGSAMLGALLIWTGTTPQLQRAVLFVIGAATMVMTMAYTPVGGLDFFLGILGGFIFVALAIQSPRSASMGATWLGTLLCLYSLHDFRTDLWLYPEMTDAGILAAGLGMPAITAYPIALSWVLLSMFLMYRAMRTLVRWRVAHSLRRR